MGEVCRARDTKLNREVALKVLPVAFASDPDRMSRFQREAQLLAALNHPNIAAIYGLEDAGAQQAIVMEMVEGDTLTGPIPIADTLRIARQIADAIEYAHDRGIIHRDLKPANIKVTPDGSVKVLDFGLAKAMDVTSDSMSGVAGTMSPTLSLAATHAGLILGTAAYMAPEQAKGKPVDRRADVWAFGLVLYEMLTGTRMFGGDSVAETLASVMKDQIALTNLPADTPASIRQLVKRCLERDPRRRLQSIGEARIILEDAIAGTPRVRPSLSPPPDSHRSDRWPWALAAVAVLTAVAATGWAWSRPDRGSSRRDTFHARSPGWHHVHVDRPKRSQHRRVAQRTLRGLHRR
jgi:serine/threonine-protein kinase